MTADLADQTASRLRPLRRRAARIARPARVRMRRRKPCVLARRRLFGWKVRLLTIISKYFGESGRAWRATGSAVLTVTGAGATRRRQGTPERSIDEDRTTLRRGRSEGQMASDFTRSSPALTLVTPRRGD